LAFLPDLAFFETWFDFFLKRCLATLMVSFAWLACTSKLVEMVKVTLGVRRNFSRKGVNVDILLIFFRLLILQCKWTFTKHLTVYSPSASILRALSTDKSKF